MIYHTGRHLALWTEYTFLETRSFIRIIIVIVRETYRDREFRQKVD